MKNVVRIALCVLLILLCASFSVWLFASFFNFFISFLQGAKVEISFYRNEYPNSIDIRSFIIWLVFFAISILAWISGIISGIISGVLIIKNKEVTRKSYNILRINFFCTIVATIPLLFTAEVSEKTIFLIPHILIIVIVKVLTSKIYSSEHNWY